MKCWLIDSEYKNSLHDALNKKAEEVDCSVTVLAESVVKLGDACILWRRGSAGGIAAIGEITDVKTEQPVRLPLATARRVSDPEPSRTWATVTFTKLLLATPVPPSALHEAGLGKVVKSARRASDQAEVLDTHWWSRSGKRAVLLDLSEDELHRLAQAAEDVQPPSDLPAMWNIPPGSVVSRSRLHQVYGGNRGTRASHSGATPNVFLFLNPDRGFLSSGSDAGFSPGPDKDTLLVAGQGQWGHGISRENLSVLSHLARGVPLRVFLASGSDCLYLGEFAIDQPRPVERWITGERPLFGKQLLLSTQRVREVQAPVFRLRQLDGIAMPENGTDPFLEAPRINLALHASDDHPAAASVRKLLATLKNDPSFAVSLGDMDEGQVLTALIQQARRQSDLDRLRAAVENPDTKEDALRKLLAEMTWIFGGEFVRTGRRSLTASDELDLVLLRPDGSLHGVELKKATIKGPLVKRDHNHVIVSSEVNDAFGQAINYLRALDESRHQILAEWKVDCRRASMTIVIGRSESPGTGVTAQEADAAIRTYNSHHSRVTITTYDRLVQNAQRMLDLTSSAAQDDPPEARAQQQ